MAKWDKWAQDFPWKHPEPPHFHDFMGFAGIRDVEKQYLPPEEQEKYEQSIGLYTPGNDPDVKKKVKWR